MGKKADPTPVIDGIKDIDLEKLKDVDLQKLQKIDVDHLQHIKEVERTEKELSLAWKTINHLADSFFEALPLIIAGLIVFGIFLLVSRLMKSIVIGVADRAKFDPAVSRLFGGLASIFMDLLGLLIALVICLPNFHPANLVAGLGLSSVALGFVFKDVLQNYMSGVLILTRKPFTVGDIIHTGDTEGTVTEVDLRATRVKTYDGELVVIPNFELYNRSIRVRTAFPERRIKLAVWISFTEPVEKAREAIYKVLRDNENVVDDPEPAVYAAELGASSIRLMVYFWFKTKSGSFFVTRDEIASGIKLALEKAGIKRPYPHSVVHLVRETDEIS